MKVRRIDDVERDAFGPCGDGWHDVPTRRFDLEPVPNDAVDSSPYVMDTVERAAFGSVDSIHAGAVHDEERIAVNLRWADETRDVSIDGAAAFVDKVAIAFPLAEAASVMTMGSNRAPINAWYWRADRSVPLDVLASGFGDVCRRDPVESGLTSEARWEDGHWHVTFRRSLSIDDDGYVDISDRTHGVAVAVWNGSNDERGPLKAYSGEFATITVEAR